MRYFTALAAIAVAVHALPEPINKPTVPSGSPAPVTQVRLAYSSNYDMSVSFSTADNRGTPYVRYGQNPNLLNQIAVGSSSTYNASWTFANKVTLQGLEPGTTYYYQPGCSGGCSSEVFSFKTSPPQNCNNNFNEFSVVAFGDLGTMGELGLSTTGGSGTAGTTLAPGERNTIQALQQSMNDYEFAWHIGDIAYADYWLKEELGGYLPNTGISNGYDVYNQILNAFYDEIANISSAKPYMVLPGNHDANCDNGGTKGYTVDICIMSQRNFTTYLNYWDMPGQASGGVSNMWYSFDYGPVHFVSFNTETDAKAGLLAPDNPAPGDPGEDAGNFGYPNEQIDWLQKDLASVDRCKTPWIIAGGHRPWYVNAPSDLNEVGQLSFEDLLYQYGVDLVLHGHVHNYQRNMPLYKNVTDPNGLNNPKAPWYIVNGIAGHYDGIDEIDASTATPYMAYGQDTTYGYGNLIFHNSTHLTYQFIASSNGSVIDQATLYKEHCPQWSW